LITLVISNKSISCIEWGKDAEGYHISRVVDNPYYKQLLLSKNPAGIISETLNSITSEIGFLGQEIEVLIDDNLVMTGGLTIDDGLDEEGIEAYIQWWINQSWPESFEYYEICSFHPETDSSFIWISGIDRSILNSIQQSLTQSGGRSISCSPVSSALISLDYPRNSIWTFIEPRSYQLSGSVGSLPFRASIRFYSGTIRAASIVGDSKSVERLLEGPSFRTPFRFVEELPEGRSDVWKNIPVQKHELDPELKTYGEAHGWKRDLHRNLGVLSVVIESESTDRILNFFDQVSVPEPEPDENARLRHLERLERAAKSEAESVPTQNNHTEQPKKKSPVVWWLLAGILLFGGIYYSGLADPYLDKWFPTKRDGTERIIAAKPQQVKTGTTIPDLRKNSVSMLNYTTAWLKKLTSSGFAVIDGKVEIYSDEGKNVFSLEPEESPPAGIIIKASAAVDSIQHWNIGQVRTFALTNYPSGNYQPVIIRLNKSQDTKDIGNRLLQLGDNVVLRKVLVQKLTGQTTVFFYIAIYS